MTDTSISDILLADESPPEWLVPELFLQGAFYCLAGEEGTGKSVLSYMLALALGGGLPIFGGLYRGSAPRRVLYFDEENSEGDRNKYIRQAWGGLVKQSKLNERQQLKIIEGLNETVRLVHFQMGTDAWRDTAASHIEDHQPHVMFFDTATPVFNIEDENHNGEATETVKGIRMLMTLTDPASSAIVLKHAKMRTQKGGRRTMRGAKAWGGMADGVLFQVKATGRPRGDGLNLTRLEPGKTRAYGLRSTLYITPSWTDSEHSGLMLDASFNRDRAHKAAEQEEERGLED